MRRVFKKPKKATPASFKPGPDPRRNTKGRPPGTPNKVTKAVKDFLREMVEDPDVQDAFKSQILMGDRGSMQAFLGSVHLIIGKPKESVEVSTSPSMAQLILLALQKSNEKGK